MTLDPGFGMEKFGSGIRHKHPGSATLQKRCYMKKDRKEIKKFCGLFSSTIEQGTAYGNNLDPDLRIRNTAENSNSTRLILGGENPCGALGERERSVPEWIHPALHGGPGESRWGRQVHHVFQKFK